MSTSKASHRKSASFAIEEFDKQWDELTKSAALAKTGQISSAEKKAPVMKVREKSLESDQLMRTVTQTDTGDSTKPLTEKKVFVYASAPTTPRSDNCRQVTYASDVVFQAHGSASPRQEGKFLDAVKDRNITQRNTEKSLSSESSIITPRSREAEKSSSTQKTRVEKFEKRVSRKFADIKLDLSELSRKLALELNTPPSSPVSTSKTPTSKPSPRKKISPLLKDVPADIRNKIAEAYVQLCDTPAYTSAGEIKKGIFFNAKMIGILSEHQIKFDEKKLQALSDDVKIRSINLRVDQDIDFSDTEYSDFYHQAADSAFMKPWANDSADISDVNGQRTGDPTKTKRTFIRDFRNSVYKIKERDGSIRKISSIDEFLDFFSSHQNKDIGMIVSNIASQNLAIFLKNVLFRRTDKNGQTQSILRLSDGTSIQPRANFKATYILSKDADDNVVIDYECHCDKNTGKGVMTAATIEENSRSIRMTDSASMTITTRVQVAPDGSWSIDDPHVKAMFWNIEKED